MNNDAFLGQWEMDPAENRYEAGQPPLSGSYTIEPDGDTYRFLMAWTNAEGQPFEMEYRTTPDGVAYPYENPDVADTNKTTRVDAFTLDTETMKDGKSIATGRRVLSPDGRTMTIVQSGVRPDGTSFKNLSLYRRKINER
jgi:hypothetical protein